MVRTYVRKTKQHFWDAEDMADAIDAVRTRRLSYEDAAAAYNVPRTTLFRRAKKDGDTREASEKRLGRFTNCFTAQQEEELVRHCLFMENRYFGLKIMDLRYLAYQFASQNGIAHPFNTEKGMAGKDWVLGFFKRHPELSLRTPEKTSIARATAFNRHNVSSFFGLLIELYDRHKFTPSQIYNVDETGITTVPNKPSKVIATKGKKQVGTLTSAERGTTTTSVICFNAAGRYIPPLMIFPRVRQNLELLEGTPPDTELVCHPSGWMNTEIFCPAWFQHFLKHAKPTAAEPVLLILDGHASHTKSIQLLETARKNFVHILCIPPHTSHRLQLLDVSFMFPLSTFYTQECELWLRNHPGRAITIRQVGQLFGKAYLRTATSKNAISGFEKTGICPLNPNIFPEEAFAASETTSRPPPKTASNPNNLSDSEDDLPLITHVQPGPSCGKGYDKTAPSCNKNTEEAGPSCSKSVQEIASSSAKVVVERIPLYNVFSHDTPSCIKSLPSLQKQMISPHDIIPIPQAEQTEKNKPSRNRGKTAVLTGSPYYNELKEKTINTIPKKVTTSVKRNVFHKESEVAKEQASNKRKRVGNDSERVNEDDDTQCIMCAGDFLKSKPGEEWVSCNKCTQWAHEECTDYDPRSEVPFVCDLCK